MAFEGHSDPGSKCVHGRMHITVMHHPTHGTHPLPYLQARVASGTREAPTCRAGLGGILRGHLDELSTACSALVGKHRAKLRMARTGNALPKDFGDGCLAILGPDEPLVLGDQPTREFVAAVFALIALSLVSTPLTRTARRYFGHHTT